MLSVSELANRCGLSCTSVLEYEKAGLLAPRSCSSEGYRWYGEEEVQRLKSVQAFRSFGVSITDICELFGAINPPQNSILLLQQFDNLEKKVTKLSRQQRAIISMLQDSGLLIDQTLAREQWIYLMVAQGFKESEITAWHDKFVALNSQNDLTFLQSLAIEGPELKVI